MCRREFIVTVAYTAELLTEFLHPIQKNIEVLVEESVHL